MLTGEIVRRLLQSKTEAAKEPVEYGMVWYVPYNTYTYMRWWCFYNAAGEEEGALCRPNPNFKTQTQTETQKHLRESLESCQSDGRKKKRQRIR